jgi:hypothetical protein
MHAEPETFRRKKFSCCRQSGNPHVQGLAELGIPATSPVRRLRLADQVAQKIHARTGSAAAGRARDVLDILLIDALGQLNHSETTDAALRVFQERATHAFPPAFIMPAEWHSELETLAIELDFPIKTPAEIEKRFREIIRELGRIAADNGDNVIPFRAYSVLPARYQSPEKLIRNKPNQHRAKRAGS